MSNFPKLPKDPGPFDKEREYDKIILPIINLVRALCAKHDIPFMFAAVVKNSDEGFMMASCAQRTKEGWAPMEMYLARKMLLGEMDVTPLGDAQNVIGMLASIRKTLNQEDCKEEQTNGTNIQKVQTQPDRGDG